VHLVFIRVARGRSRGVAATTAVPEYVLQKMYFRNGVRCLKPVGFIVSNLGGGRKLLSSKWKVLTSLFQRQGDRSALFFFRALVVRVPAEGQRGQAASQG